MMITTDSMSGASHNSIQEDIYIRERFHTTCPMFTSKIISTIFLSVLSSTDNFTVGVNYSISQKR
jgi:hypothetical protein